jgi:hypothetical protein
MENMLACEQEKLHLFGSDDDEEHVDILVDTDEASNDDDDATDLIVYEAPETPKEGMIFSTIDEVKLAFKRYAASVGFGIKARASYKRNGIVWKQIFACIREGKNRSRGKYISGKESRCGCSTQLIARLFPSDAKWHITKICLDHNHKVSPSKSRFYVCNKGMTTATKRRLELNDRAGIPVCKSFAVESVRVGGPENLSYEERDVRNHVDTMRRLRLGTGDAEAIYQYFLRKQKQNANFFHVMDIGPEGHLRHVFWADSRSRTAYEYFGDVVSFDTTYLTNKYDMPFAPFVGVNHHGQSVLLGCALLSDECTESYEWLFTTWLSCMGGKAPKAIITDQCQSIGAAVAKVFPNTRHRLCIWHIMKKVPEKIGALEERHAIVLALKRAIYDSLTVQEFEHAWKELIEGFAFKDGSLKWLGTIYDLRKKWVPVYVKDQFWAGMSSTQRSEGMNHFFDSYVNSKTSLKQFISQYDLALTCKHEKEARADFDSYHKERPLVSSIPHERQIRDLYTDNMFGKFQEELKRMLNCKAKEIRGESGLYTYEVKDITIPIGMSAAPPRLYEVLYDSTKEEVHCICRSYETRGLLCCHALTVFYEREIMVIPKHYILDRWRKDFKRIYMREKGIEQLDSSASTLLDRYVTDCTSALLFGQLIFFLFPFFSSVVLNEKLCFIIIICQKKNPCRYDAITCRCNKMADLGCESVEKMKMVFAAIEMLKERLLVIDDEDSTPHGDSSNAHGVVKDPYMVQRKGRPRTNRKQSIVEKHGKKRRRNVCTYYSYPLLSLNTIIYAN